MARESERVQAKWDEVQGHFYSHLATKPGLGNIKGETPDAFNAAVLGAFPKGTSIIVEYEGIETPSYLGPDPQ